MLSTVCGPVLQRARVGDLLARHHRPVEQLDAPRALLVDAEGDRVADRQDPARVAVGGAGVVAARRRRRCRAAAAAAARAAAARCRRVPRCRRRLRRALRCRRRYRRARAASAAARASRRRCRRCRRRHPRCPRRPCCPRRPYCRRRRCCRATPVLPPAPPALPATPVLPRDARWCPRRRSCRALPVVPAVAGRPGVAGGCAAARAGVIRESSGAQPTSKVNASAAPVRRARVSSVRSCPGNGHDPTNTFSGSRDRRCGCARRAGTAPPGIRPDRRAPAARRRPDRRARPPPRWPATSASSRSAPCG